MKASNALSSLMVASGSFPILRINHQCKHNIALQTLVILRLRFPVAGNGLPVAPFFQLRYKCQSMPNSIQTLSPSIRSWQNSMAHTLALYALKQSGISVRVSRGLAVISGCL